VFQKYGSDLKIREKKRFVGNMDKFNSFKQKIFVRQTNEIKQ